MAHYKNVYYIFDLVNYGFVSEVEKKEAREKVAAGTHKYRDKDNNCFYEEETVGEVEEETVKRPVKKPAKRGRKAKR